MKHTTSIKPLSSLERRLRFKLSEDEINDRFDSNAKELAQKARLPGFRPGKVPHSLIIDRYLDMVLKNVHAEGMREAIDFVEKLPDHDVWQITHTVIDEPDDINKTEYIVDFAVKPVLDLTQVDSLDLCDPKIIPDEDFLNRSSTFYRYEHAEGAEVTRSIQNNDRVVVLIEDIASQFSGDSRILHSEWKRQYLGTKQVIVNTALYDADQLGSLLYDELVNRSVGDVFEVDKQISNLPPSALQPEDEEIGEASNSTIDYETFDEQPENSLPKNQIPEVAPEKSIYSWLDPSRLPPRHLHVKVKILLVEEISPEAVNAEFFDREDIPYDNLDELHKAFHEYENESIRQDSLDAKHAQINTQACALNPVDVPYRVLVGLPREPQNDEKFADLGATFVPNQPISKPCVLTVQYLSIVAQFFLLQYAEENGLVPSDDAIAEYTRVEYDRLSTLGRDTDRVFEPEFQNRIRNNLIGNLVVNKIFERQSVPELSVNYYDFYYLRRSGLWTLPPKNGPFSWNPPVSLEEITETLEAEKRAKELKNRSESDGDDSDLVESNKTNTLAESDVSEPRGNAFTNWIRKKLGGSKVDKTSESDQT